MAHRINRVNQLIKKIQDGDEKALDTLYYEFGALFFGIANKYLINKDYAEEVLSDVFLDLYLKKAVSFDADKNGLNWIYKIIKNRALALNKKESGYCPFPDAEWKVGDLIQEDKLNENRDLLNALAQLDDVENAIVRLLFWEGLTMREVSKKLKMKLPTVFYRYKKILKKLENHLTIK